MAAAMLLAVLFAQAPADLDRIRKALEQAPAIDLSPESTVPRFRVTIRAPRPDRPMWEAVSPFPSYVRPVMPLTHYEFLGQTTAEPFRAGVLYPGISLGTLLKFLGGNESKEEVRRRKEAKAREEVRKEFEAFLHSIK